MISQEKILPHMPVVDVRGQQFAVVDHMEDDDTIKLTKGDGEHHHYLPMGWVALVDDSVHVDRLAHDVVNAWDDPDSK